MMSGIKVHWGSSSSIDVVGMVRHRWLIFQLLSDAQCMSALFSQIDMSMHDPLIPSPHASTSNSNTWADAPTPFACRGLSNSGQTPYRCSVLLRHNPILYSHTWLSSTVHQVPVEVPLGRGEAFLVVPETPTLVH